MNIWHLFASQVARTNPGRNVLRTSLILDVGDKVMRGQTTDDKGEVKDAKPAAVNRVMLSLFTQAHKDTIPNIHTVGVEFDHTARTVTITAFGTKDGQQIKGATTENY